MINYNISYDNLIGRADSAIADAKAIRLKVRQDLAAAGRRIPYRIGPENKAEYPTQLLPFPWEMLEPWWSVARALAAAPILAQTAKEELERGWNRILPTIETPVSLFDRKAIDGTTSFVS